MDPFLEINISDPHENDFLVASEAIARDLYRLGWDYNGTDQDYEDDNPESAE